MLYKIGFDGLLQTFNMANSANLDVIALLQTQIDKLERNLQNLKSESLKREEQAIEREKRLMALLEHQAGIVENKPAGFFSGLFKMYSGNFLVLSSGLMIFNKQVKELNLKIPNCTFEKSTYCQNVVVFAVLIVLILFAMRITVTANKGIHSPYNAPLLFRGLGRLICEVCGAEV